MIQGVTLAYLTNRKENHFEWFFNSLLNQYNSHVLLQILVIGELQDNFRVNIPNVELSIIEPLPSVIQGKCRLTKQDWFSAGNARNTAIVHAKYPYIIFADDLSVLMPGWLDSVMEAAEQKYMVLGTYRKDSEMVVENGKLISSKIESIDSRLQFCDRDVKRARGSWLYGCSFGMPLETALQVNGFDAICDCIGTEDTQFGIRVDRTGIPIYLDKRMLTVESVEGHFKEGAFFRRESFPCSKEQYFALLEKYGIADNPEREDTKYDCAWFINDLLKYFPHQTESFYNRFSLRTLRDKVISGQEITLSDMHPPTKFWFTGITLNEM